MGKDTKNESESMLQCPHASWEFREIKTMEQIDEEQIDECPPCTRCKFINDPQKARAFKNRCSLCHAPRPQKAGNEDRLPKWRKRLRYPKLQLRKQSRMKKNAK